MPTAKTVTKANFSLDGWDLGEFLKGRKKMIITVIGAIAGWIITQNPALTAVIAAAVELITAVLEYFVKEKEIPV